MSWQDGLFLDPEDPREFANDPYRCQWCQKPIDSSRINGETMPETQIIEGVVRMKSHGRTLEEALRCVRAAWAHEAEG